MLTLAVTRMWSALLTSAALKAVQSLLERAGIPSSGTESAPEVINTTARAAAASRRKEVCFDSIALAEAAAVPGVSRLPYLRGPGLAAWTFGSRRAKSWRCQDYTRNCAGSALPECRTDPHLAGAGQALSISKGLFRWLLDNVTFTLDDSADHTVCDF